jgi:DNA gyrase/topoisomerase IV subunit B
MSSHELNVTTHVGRDLMQSAALFRHEHSVAWEYVSNGLEYVDSGVNPVVKVAVESKARKITVEDNGRGMLFDELHRYFQMHGENIDRKKGKAGRGLFGTGKSAAFGIAKMLRVTTCRNGTRSQVELSRSAVESEEAEIPPAFIFTFHFLPWLRNLRPEYIR